MTEKTNILVVDDLRSMRLTLARILEDEGHKVVTAENGYQAIEAVRQTHFDIIFMDIKMPGINGVQTFREIQKVDRKAVVIMMTAYSVEDLVKEALEEGAYAVVYKPFDIKRIIATIEESLREQTLILVVDNQFSDREALRAALEDKGYRVNTTQSGAKAIQIVKSRQYDIIFLDSSLPDMSGVETFEWIKEIDPKVAVIMLTDCTETDLVKRAASNGTYACIHKPCDIELVIAMVDLIAGKKK